MIYSDTETLEGHNIGYFIDEMKIIPKPLETDLFIFEYLDNIYLPDIINDTNTLKNEEFTKFFRNNGNFDPSSNYKNSYNGDCNIWCYYEKNIQNYTIQISFVRVSNIFEEINKNSTKILSLIHKTINYKNNLGSGNLDIMADIFLKKNITQTKNLINCDYSIEYIEANEKYLTDKMIKMENNCFELLSSDKLLMIDNEHIYNYSKYCFQKYDDLNLIKKIKGGVLFDNTLSNKILKISFLAKNDPSVNILVIVEDKDLLEWKKECKKYEILHNITIYSYEKLKKYREYYINEKNIKKKYINIENNFEKFRNYDTRMFIDINFNTDNLDVDKRKIFEWFVDLEIKYKWIFISPKNNISNELLHFFHNYFCERTYYVHSVRLKYNMTAYKKILFDCVI